MNPVDKGYFGGCLIGFAGGMLSFGPLTPVFMAIILFIFLMGTALYFTA